MDTPELSNLIFARSSVGVCQPRLRISYRVTGQNVAQEMRETKWQLI